MAQSNDRASQMILNASHGHTTGNTAGVNGSGSDKPHKQKKKNERFKVTDVQTVMQNIKQVANFAQKHNNHGSHQDKLSQAIAMGIASLVQDVIEMCKGNLCTFNVPCVALYLLFCRQIKFKHRNCFSILFFFYLMCTFETLVICDVPSHKLVNEKDRYGTPFLVAAAQFSLQVFCVSFLFYFFNATSIYVCIKI